MSAEGRRLREGAAAAPPIFNWGLVSKYRGELFGFAILWIMLLHSHEMNPIPHNPYISRYLLYDSWVRIGGTGVDVFLFLSGIGLFYAMGKKPGLLSFYGKRLKRILIPYLIIGTVYWWLRHYIFLHTPERFWEDLSLVSFFTRGVVTFWYIVLILCLYLAAPLLLALFRTRLRTPILIVCFGLYLAFNCWLAARDPHRFHYLEKATTRFFIFTLGCYFGQIVYEKRAMSRLWVLYGILVMTCHNLVPFVVKLHAHFMPVKLSKRMWCGAAALALCALLPILLELLQAERLNRFLSYMGSISLELYLSHVALKNIVRMSCPDMQSWRTSKCLIVYGVVVILGATLFSSLFHLIQTRIEGAIASKRKEKSPQ